MKRLASITLGLSVLACGPAIDVGVDTDVGTGSSGESTAPGPGTTTTSPQVTTSTTTGPAPTTDPEPTTGPGPTTTPPTATDPTIGPGDSSSGPFTGSSSSGSATGGSSSSSSSSGFATGGSSGGLGGLPDGSDCTLDSECASQHCYVTGIGGICGECSGDADCDFGCTQPNPLAMPPQGSVCNDGGLGDGCESDAPCVGLECVSVIDLLGILSFSTCGECDVDSDCMPGQVCNIDVDIGSLTGVWTCVPTGTVGLGEICDVEGSGDQACASTHCVAASLKGLLEYGVCSECELDADCLPGEICVEPDLGLDGSATAGYCS